ncbi:MAG: hypothetical protein AAB361_02265 [Patescibacteria group bacterium]
MCNSRGEKFVVPLKPDAKLGWWIGEIISGRYLQKMNGQEIFVYRINILWIENPEYSCNSVQTSGPFREFENEAEAMNHLALKKRAVLSK